MALPIKIGFFLAFLLAFSGLAYAGYVAQIRLNRPLSAMASLIQGLLGIAEVLALTLYVFLLARFFNVWLTVSLLATVAVSMVLGLVVRGLVGSRTAQVESLWETFGMGASTPSTAFVESGIGLLIVVGLPVAAGIAYFSHQIPSPAGTLWILRLMLLGGFLSGELVLMLPTIGLFVLQSVEDDARTWMLVSRSLGLVIGGMYVALTLWAFNLVQRRGAFSAKEVFGELSVALVVGLISYFVATSLIPYVVGSKRSAAWRGAFDAARDSLVAELVETLALPNKPMKLERLEQLKIRWQEEQEELRDDPLVGFWERIDTGELDPETVAKQYQGFVRALDESHQEFRRRDPRFQQLDWLHEFGERLDGIIDAVGSKKSEPAVAKVSQDWVAFFRQQKEEMDKRLAAARPTKSRLAVLTSFLVSTGIMGVVIAPVAQAISGKIAQSLK